MNKEPEGWTGMTVDSDKLHHYIVYRTSLCGAVTKYRETLTAPHKAGTPHDESECLKCYRLIEFANKFEKAKR